jgi:hypothetical protein
MYFQAKPKSKKKKSTTDGNITDGASEEAATPD